MNFPLLSSLETLPSHISRSTYNPSAFQTGIVHLGLGAFHRSHQAFYTDAALEESGGDWRILGVSMRDSIIPQRVNAQNGLYTLVINNVGGAKARVIASISGALSASINTAAILDAMSSPLTKIVSLTVTEKGYGINRDHGGIDHSNQIIIDDLQNPGTPKGVLGLIVRSLELRRLSNIAPFTVLCCDNLQNNGKFVSRGVLDYAQRLNPELGRWVADNVSFPSTMVDRITPAQSERTLSNAALLIGHRDYLAIEAEPFHQWVIEDEFVNGRPDWEVAGAMFTNNVAPFEEMKLRMLNGTHSMLAYAGVLANKKYVRDAMLDKSIAKLAARHLRSSANTLSEIQGLDYKSYASDLIVRFSNPEIDHETKQIAGDGSQKLPQRIFKPAVFAVERGLSIRPFAFATALWMRYCCGKNDNGDTYDISDPIESRIRIAASNENINEVVNLFSDIPGLVPRELSTNKVWNKEVLNYLNSLKQSGVRTTLDREANDIAN